MKAQSAFFQADCYRTANLLRVTRRNPCSMSIVHDLDCQIPLTHHGKEGDRTVLPRTE